MMFDVHTIRSDFPILDTKVYDKPLVYFDNAATTQMPRAVMEAMAQHYTMSNANVHRGIHYLSEKSSEAMDQARAIAAQFVSSPAARQIVFTSGTTESLNTVAFSYLRGKLKGGDRVVVTEFEHHSNYIVWQQLCLEAGAEFVVVPEKDGNLDMDAFAEAVNERTQLVAIAMVSNVTGACLPIADAIAAAHAFEIPVCVDAAQAARQPIDVRALDCEFLCFSGHKMMGPAGTGILYVKENVAEEMRPFKFGGGMVGTVSRAETTFAALPYILEAGTPNYPGAIALGTAMEYLRGIGLAEIAQYEDKLVQELERTLSGIPGVAVISSGVRKHGAVSITIDGIHPYDAASFLDKFGIAVRSGDLCAQPLVHKLGYDALIRFSPAFYNTFEEIAYIGEALRKTIEMMNKWK
jgi:cysteine desulfurase/selenocysteine lyase